MKKALLVGVSAALVGSVFIATPAFAAPFGGGLVEVGPDSGSWSSGAWSNLSLFGPSNSTWASHDGRVTWDATGAYLTNLDQSDGASLTCSIPADLSEASDGSGDMILTCDPQTVDNGLGPLEVRTEFRFYADGQTVRQRFTIANNGTIAVDNQVLEIYANAIQDIETSVAFTSSAGVIDGWATDSATPTTTMTSAADLRWITNLRSGGLTIPVVEYAVGNAGSPLLPAEDPTNSRISGGMGNGFDTSWTYFELPSIAPGESVDILTFSTSFLFDPTMTAEAPLNSVQTASFHKVEEAIADTSFQTDAVIFAGIEDPSSVLNWIVTPPPAPAAGSNLATTGRDADSATVLGALAMLVLSAGAGVLLARRRRASVL